MTMINAAITPMQEIEIFGCPALFTPNRVSRDTVHMLFPYELCVRTDELSQPFFIKEQAGEQDILGTVLTLLPLDIPKGGRLVLPFDLGESSSTRCNPAAFESKYMEPQPDSAERFGKALYED